MNETSHSVQLTVEQQISEMKTYNIYHFFFIAFIGGVIPIMVLGTKNANWFNIPKKYSYSIIAVGIILLLSKYWMFHLVFSGALLIKAQVVRYGYKFACLLYYYLYLVILTKPYKQHINSHGELTPIIKPAVTWIIVGIIVEFALLRLAFA
ncbi:hypothetical protein HHO41_15220 [Bacillus sp. DNRA2]|uniref:hypothetical protein n=1 Tax=Bacillus sp. DNRA2 TaxID=2723053 RepID=UPI00145F2BFD|nr:hypothetical protein [Bacillus sp. DNRA2]NMD71649.1 hypothetical protein [Bacillus sp. DNRA2]